jgi:hypothetical protein
VHAEGSGQYSSEKRYDQAAVVALVAAEPRATGVAYERFTAKDRSRFCLSRKLRHRLGDARRACDSLAAMPEQPFLDRAAGSFRPRARPLHGRRALVPACACAARAQPSAPACAKVTSATPRRRCIRSPDRA